VLTLLGIVTLLASASRASDLGPGDRIVFQDTFDDLSMCGWRATSGKTVTVEGTTYDGRGALRLSGQDTEVTIEKEVELNVTENSYLCFGYGHSAACQMRISLVSAGGKEHSVAVTIPAYAWWRPQTFHIITGFTPAVPSRTRVVRLKMSLMKADTVSLILDNIAFLEAHSLYALGELLPPPCLVKNPLRFKLPEDLAHPVANNFWVRRCMYGKTGKRPPRDTVLERSDQFIEDLLDQEMRIPRGIPGCGVSDGKCPKHKDLELSFDPERPKWHHCPKCDKNYDDGAHQNAWKKKYCAYLSEVFSDLIHAYGYTREAKYAEVAKKILYAFAEDVHWSAQSKNVGAPAWPPSGYWYFLYDRIAGSEAFSPEDRKLIGHHLLAQTWMGSKGGRLSNFAGRGNTVEFFNSLISHRPERLDHVLNNKIGRMVEYGTSDEGLWIQNSPGYHAFFFNYYIELARACQRLKLGIDLFNHNFGTKSFKNLFEIYLLAAMPDGRMPAVNDNRSRRPGIGARAKIDMAYKIYGDERFKWDSKKLLPSVHLPSTGWAILRSNAPTREEQTFLMLTYRRGTKDGHKHQDWFQIILYAAGAYVSPDLDVPAYGGVGYGDYYRAPTSHNTALVNGLASAREGEPLFFKETNSLKVVDVASGGGLAKNRRIVAMEVDGDYIVDLYWVNSQDARTYDWLYHNWGKLGISLPMQPSSRPDGPYFACISDWESAVTDDTWTAAWDITDGMEPETCPVEKAPAPPLPKPSVPTDEPGANAKGADEGDEDLGLEDDEEEPKASEPKAPPKRTRWTLPFSGAASPKHIRLTMLPGTRTTVQAAKGFGYTIDERIPMVVVRRSDLRSTLYATILEPVNGLRAVKSVVQRERAPGVGHTQAFLVETTKGKDYFLAPHGAQLAWKEQDVSMAGDIGIIAARKGVVRDLFLLRGTRLAKGRFGIQCDKPLAIHLARTDKGYALENQSDSGGTATVLLGAPSRASVRPVGQEEAGEIPLTVSDTSISFPIAGKTTYEIATAE